MTLLRAPDGLVGVAVFPIALLAADGGATYYVSALTREGDEYFTELRGSRPHATRPKPAQPKPAPAPVTTPATTPNPP